jgi:hypothetical protein
VIDDPVLVRLREALDAEEALIDEPAGWDAVHEFEDRHGVTLPEPYRGFVATVANGIDAGPPDQGLEPLGGAPWGWPAPAVGTLSRPFPLTAGWSVDDARAAGPEITVRSLRADGLLPLGGDGCDTYWALVVSGAQRGHVWWFTDGGAQPFGREFGYTTGEPGFAGWLLHWCAHKEWWDAG